MRRILLSEETVLELLRLNARGSVQDRNLIAAILEVHLNWRNPYGGIARLYLSGVRVEQRENSRKGGRHPKRRLWADALADDLAGKSPQKAWEAIEESSEVPDYPNIEAGGRRWIVYRDRKEVVAVDEKTGHEEHISQYTFFRHYLKRK
jgi:hypothetical protein